MNYAKKGIHVRMSWFEEETNKINKIGYKGFYAYLSLFKFLVYNQEYEYTFITSFGMLRKETGYSTQEVFDLIRLLEKYKIIKVNITRWDRMMDDNKNILDDKIMVIYAIDKPETERVQNDRGQWVDKPKTEHDKYINVNLPMMQHYIDIGLSERCCALYCLIKKLSNGGVQKKAWMSINKMADILGIGDNYLNHMIYEMNRKYLLASYYTNSTKKRVVDGKKVQGKSFEHFLLYRLEDQKGFLGANKEQIDRNIKKWDKRNKDKTIKKIDKSVLINNDDSAEDVVPDFNLNMSDDEIEEDGYDVDFSDIATYGWTD